MMHYSRTASAIGVIVVASILTTACNKSERSGSSVDSVEAEFSPDIRLVRNGALPGYDKTTVGKAVEGSFQNSNWRSFTTAKGVEVIEYTRPITPLV
jgi:predicted small secreted protein